LKQRRGEREAEDPSDVLVHSTSKSCRGGNDHDRHRIGARGLGEKEEEMRGRKKKRKRKKSPSKETDDHFRQSTF